MAGSGMVLSRLALAVLAGCAMVGCAEIRSPPAGQTSATRESGILVDRGIGAIPSAGVDGRPPIGTPAHYDHEAERATARGYGQATPFSPPGAPAMLPPFPRPY